MAVVFFKGKEEADLRKDFIEGLEKNGWNRDLEWDWDEDCEMPVDYEWAADIENGYKMIIFGSEENPNSFKFIRVELWALQEDAQPIKKSQAQISINNIDNICIDHDRLYISMNASHTDFIDF